MHSHPQIKVIGANGQVSLGKEFAGKTVAIEQIDDGTWVIKAGKFIPDSEKWLYQRSNMSRLERALTWAEKHEPTDNFDELAKAIESGAHQD